MGPFTVEPSPRWAPAAHEAGEGSSVSAHHVPARWISRAWRSFEAVAAFAAILVASAFLWWSVPRPGTLDAEPSLRLPSDAVLESPVAEAPGAGDEAVKTGSFAFPAPPCRVVSTDPLILNAAAGQLREGRRASMDDEQHAMLAEFLARRMDAAEVAAAVAAKAAADPGTPTDHPLRWSDEFYPLETRGHYRPGGVFMQSLHVVWKGTGSAWKGTGIASWLFRSISMTSVVCCHHSVHERLLCALWFATPVPVSVKLSPPVTCRARGAAAAQVDVVRQLGQRYQHRQRVDAAAGGPPPEQPGQHHCSTEPAGAGGASCSPPPAAKAPPAPAGVPAARVFPAVHQPRSRAIRAAGECQRH